MSTETTIVTDPTLAKTADATMKTIKKLDTAAPPTITTTNDVASITTPRTANRKITPIMMESTITSMITDVTKKEKNFSKI